MKKIFGFLISTIALIVLASCNGNEPLQPQNSEQKAFSAVIEQPDENDGSRVHLDGSTLFWSASDKVALISGGSKFNYTTSAGDGNFTADGAQAALGLISAAYYPADGISADGTAVTLPATQAYVAGSFAPGAYPMVAHFDYTTPTVLTFNGLCGIVRLNLSLSQALGEESVTSIELEAGSALSGIFTLTNSGLEYSGTSDNDKKLSLDCTESNVKIGQNATSFFIVIPEGSYEGLKITVTTPLKKRTFTSNKPIVVTRAHFTDITLTVSNLDHRYRIPEGGIETLTYSQAKTKAFTMADLTPIFQYNSMLNFGATGFSTVGKNNKFKAVVLEYPTLSGPNDEVVWASGRIFFACDSKGNVVKPDHIVLDSHYTISTNDECPSRFWTFDIGIALQMGLVVAPDGIGFGSTVNMPHPYLCYDECARIELDMVRAAKSYLKDCGMTVPDNTAFYSIGYSQGGGTALGVQRYIENKGLESEFNIKRTYCGGGPYKPSLFLTSALTSPGLVTYPAGIPMMLIGLKATYPSIVEGSLESYFTANFNAADIIGIINRKQTENVNAAIYQAVGGNSSTSIPVTSILSAEALNTSGSKYNSMMRVLAMQDLTDASQWVAGKPKAPVYAFHYELDELVPATQMEALKASSMRNITYEKANYTMAASLYPEIGCHSGYAGIYYARMISGAYKQ